MEAVAILVIFVEFIFIGLMYFWAFDMNETLNRIIKNFNCVSNELSTAMKTIDELERGANVLKQEVKTVRLILGTDEAASFEFVQNMITKLRDDSTTLMQVIATIDNKKEQTDD